MKTILLSSGKQIPVLGQGTWLMGENHSKRQIEIEAIRQGIDLGVTLIDTAEMYGEGAAEKLIGEAIEGHRKDVFLVSKVYPHNASLQGVQQACERSLRRLRTDYLDLYLLHWRGTVPLEQTLEAFQLLKKSGKILDYGVSNFDTDDMEEAFDLTGGDEIVTNQVLYNLRNRGIEYDLLPWCSQRKIPVMAYSPIEHAGGDQKGMLNNPSLKSIASRYNATPAQIAIAWLLHQQNVITIPKASNPAHVIENRKALDIELSENDLKELDTAFPSPRRKTRLAMR